MLHATSSGHPHLIASTTPVLSTITTIRDWETETTNRTLADNPRLTGHACVPSPHVTCFWGNAKHAAYTITHVAWGYGDHNR